MSDSRSELILKLKEIFRSDQSDLDFGIYKILNHRRDEIHNFIETELVQKAEDEFKDLMKRSSESLAEELETLRTEINRDFGDGTISPTGEIVRNHDAPKLVQYNQLKSEFEDSTNVQLEIFNVFNHVYEFFNRYYDSGDFIPSRRFGGREKYVIPYNGQDVSLHWTNQDQYYVKTTEDYSKYSFIIEDYHIHFNLKQSYPPFTDNIGTDAFFILNRDNPFDFYSDQNVIDIYFEHRPLVNADLDYYNLTKRSQKTSKFNAIHAHNLQSITDELSNQSLSKLVTPSLNKNLLEYSQKNDLDFFIHKNLGNFLKRELDFYIKNEVLPTEEWLNNDPINDDMLKRKIKTIKAISELIIEALHELETYQQNLFEKKKFVLRTDYCISLDRIPVTFYDEIGSNKEQVSEWRTLFKLDEFLSGTLFSINDTKTLSSDQLANNKYLVLDTKHFSLDFKYRLLSTFNNLNQDITGLCIKGDNWHSLNLLENQFANKIKCVYIDPPYNTNSREFLYKDGYKHSSWISMMENRIEKSRNLIRKDGLFISHIDENERETLILLLKLMFGEANYIGDVIWDKRNPKGDSKEIAYQHESIVYSAIDKIQAKSNTSYMRKKENVDSIHQKVKSLMGNIGKFVVPESISRYVKQMDYPTEVLDKLKIKYTLEDVQKEFNTWISMQNFSGGEKAYNKIDENGRIYQPVSMAWPNSRAPAEFHYEVPHPITKLPCKTPPNGWRYKQETMNAYLQNNDIWFGGDESVQPRRKYYLDEHTEENLSSVLTYGGDSASDLKPLGFRFPTTKPLYVCNRILEAILDRTDVVLDFFAGSGSTAHSIIEINEEDGGDRKYILLEFGDQFDSIIIPRLKKIMYSNEWKDGSPISRIGRSHAFKYQYIEQYEDTLNNLLYSSDDGYAQTTLQISSGEYIRYVLRKQSYENHVLLNLDDFVLPFEYKINIIQNREESVMNIDLIESFNYLIGLNVEIIKQYCNDDAKYVIIYGKVGQTKNTLVIWRNFNEDILTEEKQFIEKIVIPDVHKDGSQPLDIFVNVDSYIIGAQSIETVFKEQMGVK